MEDFEQGLQEVEGGREADQVAVMNGVSGQIMSADHFRGEHQVGVWGRQDKWEGLQIGDGGGGLCWQSHCWVLVMIACDR